MGSKFWVKLYIEILNDRKVARLSTHLRWRMVECFLLAGLLDKNGRLPGVDEAAWMLRSPEQKIQEDWDALVAAEILVTEAPEGPDEPPVYWVKNYAKRQAADSPAKRMHEFRKRQHKAEYYDEEGDVTSSLRNSYEPVTSRNKSVTEREREEREERESSGSSPSFNGRYEPVTSRNENVTIDSAEAQGLIYALYESEIGPLTPHIADTIGDLLDSYPVNWIEEAVHIASENNVRKISYVNGILRSWYIDGKDSGKPAEQAASLDDELERRGYES